MVINDVSKIYCNKYREAGGYNARNFLTPLPLKGRAIVQNF